MTLTQKDLDDIEQLIDVKIKFALKHLPSKDEFFKAMDQIMGELETIRQEQTLITHSQKDHEDRISSLEEIHPQGQHPVL